MRIIWTQQAISDLNHAYDYIAETAPESGTAIIERIEKSLEALSNFPEMGRKGRVNNTRELIVPKTPFILPYRIRKNRIEILGVIHATRRWPSSFE
ncbi:type II toxin-antitoxin system RelE/ParE family toxin [Kovacikia minuta CCNUW1]|uniref:type II toxin-antitoxin system RelE/ParE family toxin n=1 Tax=Kovacikia minuta TaxID=2931930 RepID=UPI001CC9A9AF|nr:type II toxin-antitoxin system RelE/ParE family toxin [Kovacikia minuta]UBF26922.1 type II toxin-antitoxin system RelE/ParE family toxin [Kovacikia minuta CCNUW1]